MANTFYNIKTYTLVSNSANGVTFSAIPQTYAHLILKISARSTSSGAGDDVKITINGNTSATYTSLKLYGEGSTTGQSYSNAVWSSSAPYFGALSGGATEASTFSSHDITFPNYTSSVTKNGISYSVAPNNSASAFGLNWNALYTSDTNPITSIKIESYNASSNTLASGSTISLYGLASS
jgi:hypothetical protein